MVMRTIYGSGALVHWIVLMIMRIEVFQKGGTSGPPESRAKLCFCVKCRDSRVWLF